METGIVTNWSKPVPRFPWMTLVISVLCVMATSIHSMLPPIAQGAMLDLAGVSPSLVIEVLNQPLTGWADDQFLTLFSALFIHTSWLHLAGNMAYFWVFGFPLERRLGWLGMITAFLLCGAIANFLVCLRLPDLASPIIGASGAVSAVVGTYLVLFPFSSIGMLLPLGLFLQVARVPSLLVIGSWFVLQLVYTVFGPITGVVAWWTHMTGLALGLIFALLIRATAKIVNTR